MDSMDDLAHLEEETRLTQQEITQDELPLQDTPARDEKTSNPETLKI